MSRTVAGGRTTSFEFVRIEARADGIFYIAQPGGRPPLDFKLASESPNELVFVNPGHADHLKEIVYRREVDGRSTARIEDENKRPDVRRGLSVSAFPGRHREPMRRAEVDRAAAIVRAPVRRAA